MKVMRTDSLCKFSCFSIRLSSVLISRPVHSQVRQSIWTFSPKSYLLLLNDLDPLTQQEMNLNSLKHASFNHYLCILGCVYP